MYLLLSYLAINNTAFNSACISYEFVGIFHLTHWQSDSVQTEDIYFLSEVNDNSSSLAFLKASGYGLVRLSILQAQPSISAVQF